MSARRDLLAATWTMERAIDRLFAPLGPAIARAVAASAEDGRITEDARRRILVVVDNELATIYPMYRGGPCRLQTAILAAEAAIWRRPVDAAANELERRAGERLTERIREG